MADEQDPEEPKKKGFGGKITEGIKGVVEDTKEGAKLQTDLLKMQIGMMMDDFKVVELSNMAFKKGEPVDMAKLDQAVENIRQLVDARGLGAGIVLKPLKNQMEKWYKEIKNAQPKEPEENS